LEKITRAYTEGKPYEGRNVGPMTLDDIISVYGQKDMGQAASIQGVPATSDMRGMTDYFNLIEGMKAGQAKTALESLRNLGKDVNVEERLKDLIQQTQSKFIQVHEDGALEIGGERLEISGFLQDQLRQFNERVNRVRGQQGSIVIDLMGGGYLHPNRFNRILEELLENPEMLQEGLEIENFIGWDSKGNWGYNDGALVRAQLVGDVIRVQVQSLAQRYEELSDRLQSEIIAKMKTEPQALVLSEKTLGIEVSKVEGQVVVKAQAYSFEKFYEQLLEAKQKGVNLLKIAIPVVLPEGISRNEVNEELILRAVLGEEGYEALKRAGLEEELYVAFYASNHPAVVNEELGEQVKADVINQFAERQVTLGDKSFAFAVMEEEEKLYGDLSEYLYWIVEGQLDAKKLLLIAEQLTGVEDEELRDFLKKADPETIEEMNNHRLSTPKTMMEEFDLRIKTQRQTATMA
jgi:hypothetical protein